MRRVLVRPSLAHLSDQAQGRPYISPLLRAVYSKLANLKFCPKQSDFFYPKPYEQSNSVHTETCRNFSKQPPPRRLSSTQRPNSRLKHETQPRAAAGFRKYVVEARRIELRSILDNPRGSTSLVNVLVLELRRPLTGFFVPYRFALSLGHTDYVPKSIPLK